MKKLSTHTKIMCTRHCVCLHGFQTITNTHQLQQQELAKQFCFMNMCFNMYLEPYCLDLCFVCSVIYKRATAAQAELDDVNLVATNCHESISRMHQHRCASSCYLYWIFTAGCVYVYWHKRCMMPRRQKRSCVTE